MNGLLDQKAINKIMFTVSHYPESNDVSISIDIHTLAKATNLDKARKQVKKTLPTLLAAFQDLGFEPQNRGKITWDEQLAHNGELKLHPPYDASLGEIEEKAKIALLRVLLLKDFAAAKRETQREAETRKLITDILLSFVGDKELETPDVIAIIDQLSKSLTLKSAKQPEP